ncbi:transposase [Gordonia sp. PDNC005]|uniref:transposase n=1 Tax=Gordonia sp. MMO-8 TaxID=3127886 RepID=UPI001963667C|nr:transposase [Gordonia sp. PDNC005]
MARIASQLYLDPETLRSWVRRFEDGQTAVPGVETVSDIDRVRQLEKENSEPESAQGDAQPF